MRNRFTVKEAAKEIDFGIDVTEPMSIRLRRIRTVLRQIRVQTVRETVVSLRRSGWLKEDDALAIMATLPTMKRWSN